MARETISVQGITKALLVGLATGAVIGTALLFPGVGYLYREFKREKWEKARKRGALKTLIRRLEKQRLISWRDKDEKTVLTLTEKGKKKVLQYNLEDLKLEKPNKWDGWFRVIVFDIPEKKKVAREILRNKLKELEFYQLQKSVFVTPFECSDEIDFLRHTLEISPYVAYILAKEVSNVDVKTWFTREYSTSIDSIE